MITVFIAQNEDKVKEIIIEMLKETGNKNINIIKQEGAIKIYKDSEIKDTVSLKEKIVELEDALYRNKQNALYKAILDEVERPLFEHILELTEGNQLKAARILGLNRNTIRNKIKKLRINPEAYKQ